jgi:hypothetical protein
VYISGQSTIKAGLTGEKVVPTMRRAYASSETTLVSVGILLGKLDGSIVGDGELGLVRYVGSVPCSTVGLPTGAALYVSDAGSLSLVQGSFACQVGYVSKGNSATGAIFVSATASGSGSADLPGSRTLWVDNGRTDNYVPDGTIVKPYPNVQAAIDVVPIGNTYETPYAILAMSGVYGPFTCDKNYVTVVGSGWAGTKIVSSDNASAVVLTGVYSGLAHLTVSTTSAVADNTSAAVHVSNVAVLDTVAVYAEGTEGGGPKALWADAGGVLATGCLFSSGENDACDLGAAEGSFFGCAFIGSTSSPYYGLRFSGTAPLIGGGCSFSGAGYISGAPTLLSLAQTVKNDSGFRADLPSVSQLLSFIGQYLPQPVYSNAEPTVSDSQRVVLWEQTDPGDPSSIIGTFMLYKRSDNVVTKVELTA